VAAKNIVERRPRVTALYVTEPRLGAHPLQRVDEGGFEIGKVGLFVRELWPEGQCAASRPRPEVSRIDRSTILVVPLATGSRDTQ
jgi:hypothetical protein